MFLHRVSDLTGSGSIEAVDNVVLFVHRAEYYKTNDAPGIAEVIISKSRNGPTGVIKLGFLRNLTRFENLAAVAKPL